VASYRIAVIPGDGIGREVMPPALKIIQAVSALHGFDCQFQHFDWSCETYQQTGQMMPADGLKHLREHDSILLGAVGFPGVPDHVSLWGLLIPIRREFDQYVNLRPVRMLRGVPSPLRDRGPDDINFWIVRENTEGEYSQIGGRFAVGSEAEGVTQVAVFTRRGTDRIMRYAFELATKLKRLHVSSATKSNGIYHSMPYWDERFDAMAREFPAVRTDRHHIDVLCARLVMSPQQFDVIVGSNLFGDILSDLGPGLTGTIALAPSGNINPTRAFPSMFEPVHGSAPDIAGRGVANPIGQIWAAAMMLEHLGQTAAAQQILQAIEATTASADTPLTPDLKGTGTTTQLGDAILAALGKAV
jgi:tartrate dehydrogenase/decarboxylase/D-malate dehydrogenase